MNDDTRKIEALLFLAGEAVSVNELARLIQKPLSQTRGVLSELAEELSEHGITIIETDTHAQLTTSKQVSTYLQQFLQGEATNISAAAAETLAIIAYRGPVTRVDVEAIRGVDCRRMIRQLVARGLIRKHSTTGHLTTYSITEEFLQYTGVTRREDLPDFATLSEVPATSEHPAKSNE